MPAKTNTERKWFVSVLF